MSRRPSSHRLLVAPAAALLLLAAACGGDDSDAEPTTTAPATAAGDAATAAAPSGAFPVTVEHYFGTTTIDEQPTRVLAMGDYVELDSLLALGVRPIAYGFTNSWATGTPPWQVDAGIEALEQFDAGGELSPETIATYDPDLILAMPSPAEDQLEDLQAIAPVIGVSWNADWRDALRIVAEATGTTATADTLVTEVEGEIAAAREQLSAYGALNTMIGSLYGDVLYVQGAESPVTKLLAAVGLTVQPGPEPVLTEYSLEQVPELGAAEMLFALATDPDGTATAEASPLWQALPAVTAGRYTAIEPVLSRGLGDGFSPLSADWVLPQLIELVTETAEGRGTPQG